MADQSGSLSPDESYSGTPDTSAVSAGSSASFSDLAVSSIISHKEKSAAQKWSKLVKRKNKKTEEKKKKNKISKNDFYAKTAEFKVWLSEVKKQKFENLNQKQQKEYFKKFVKKWNAKKLDTKYYRGVLWAVGTPDTQTSWAMPTNVDVTPGSVGEDVLEEKYSRTGTLQATGLGTFGKGTGANILKELRTMENAQSRMSDNIKQDTEHKDGPRLLLLQQLFVPIRQNLVDNTDEKIIQLSDDNWPAPPSPYSTGVGGTCKQNKLRDKVSDADNMQLPPYPHTSCLGPRYKSNRLIKVDVPSIHSSQLTKPAVAPKPIARRTRPASCIDGAVPRSAPTPPKRSSSSENVRTRSQVDATTVDSESSKLANAPRQMTRLVKVSDATKRLKGADHPHMQSIQQGSSHDEDKLHGDQTKNEQILLESRESDVKHGRERSDMLHDMGFGQKRHLTACESEPPDGERKKDGIRHHRPEPAAGEPEAKLLRHDSYASRLSSASSVVLEMLSSKKATVKPGQATRPRLASNCHYESLPDNKKYDGTHSSSADEEILTPGKSSLSTLL